MGALADRSLGLGFAAGGMIVAALGIPLMLAWTPWLARNGERATLEEPVGVGGD